MPAVWALPSRRSATFCPQPVGRGTPRRTALFKCRTQVADSMTEADGPSKISHLNARRIWEGRWPLGMIQRPEFGSHYSGYGEGLSSTSGWPIQTQEIEKPLGVGYFEAASVAALFARRSSAVASSSRNPGCRSQRVSCEPAAGRFRMPCFGAIRRRAKQRRLLSSSRKVRSEEGAVILRPGTKRFALEPKSKRA